MTGSGRTGATGGTGAGAGAAAGARTAATAGRPSSSTVLVSASVLFITAFFGRS